MMNRSGGTSRANKGASLLSYGLIVGLISVVALTAVTDVGQSGQNLFGTVDNSLGAVIGTQATSPAPSGPQNTAPPAITGNASRLVTVAADPGIWEGNPVITYQWRRDGVDIPGATEATYTLVQDDVGSTVSVAVSATGSGDTSTAIATLSPAVATLDCVEAFPYGQKNGLISTGETFIYAGINTISANSCRFGAVRVPSVGGGSSIRADSGSANQWCLEYIGHPMVTYTSAGSSSYNSTRPTWNGGSWIDLNSSDFYVLNVTCSIP
ncbi:MAG: hypothetical protein Alpg2KO_09350 [Alphaproteobacteria bacterium]